jgi:uncharacterized iron-regulated membrane protein
MSTVSEHDPELADDPSIDETSDTSTSPDGTAGQSGKARAKRSGGLFRAFWRWHFYASILVVPIMLMLAVTGLIYLFRWQIDPAMHPGVLTVSVPAHGAPIPLAAQEAAVTAAYPGKAITAVQQSAENRATYFTISVGGEDSRNVYVDPYTGKVLGNLAPQDVLSNIAVKIHGNIVFGKVRDIPMFHDPIVGKDLVLGDLGDRIIELATCWAIVMTLTGYYLFVRGRGARLKRVASGARAAALRNRHGVIGAALGAGILLLVLSGLPWTGLWGGKVQDWASGQGLSLWGDDPGAKSTLGDKLTGIGSNSAPAPWAEGAAPMPANMPGMDHTGTAGAIGTGPGGKISIDQAAAAAKADGLPSPFYITYPDEKDGVYSVLADQWHDEANPAFNDVSQEGTAHVDQYSGQVIARYGYADYSVAAKTVSQGIALHEGRRFGSFNTVGTTAFCLGIIFLCVSGPLMWWKRRPTWGGLAAPRGRMPLKATPALLVAGVLLAVFLPLFGATLLLVLVLDQLILPRLPKLAATLNRT